MSEPNRRRPRRIVLALGALAALGLWAGWWAKSLSIDRLSYGHATWTMPLPFLSGDFRVHVEPTARAHARGLDVYSQPHWVFASFPYPPMVPRAFSWVALMRPRAASHVWFGVTTAIFAGSALAVARCRRGLGLAEVPRGLLLAAILFATPTLVALERGQIDPVALALLGLVALLLRRRDAAAELGAGSVLALAAWIKYYPGLAVLALIGLRRWRALAAFVVVAGAIGLYDLEGVRRSIANGRTLVPLAADGAPMIHPVMHGIGQFWPHLARAWGLGGLAGLPTPLVMAALLGPALALVVLKLDAARRRGADPGPATWPALLWLAAAATFALPYSNDYNLALLPVALLAVWDRRDPLAVHLAVGMLLPYWQPLAILIDPKLLFVAKLAVLYAASVCLARRLDERPAPAPAVAESAPRPHLTTADRTRIADQAEDRAR